MAIPRREPRGHKCLGSSAHINHYDFPQAVHPTSQYPHKRVTTASHCTTDSQPNRSTYPGTKRGHGHADDRPSCPNDRSTVLQPPYAGRQHGQQGPGRHQRGPSNTARITPTCPPTHRPTPSRRGSHSANPITTTTYTHSPRLKTPTQANLTPPGQTAYLQPIRPS